MEFKSPANLIQLEQYKSVYDGFAISIHIVDHCDLNCMNCSHFSSIAAPWFISEKLWTDQLQLLSKKLNNKLSHLIILGGEPFLHPNIKKLILIAQSIFPNTMISILTNGKIINSWTEKQWSNFNNQLNSNVYITVSKYPSVEYDNLINNNHILNYHIRTTFDKTTINPKGNENINNFFKCYRDNKYYFTLKNYKIYYCPFAAYINNYNQYFNQSIPITSLDFLDLNTLTLEKLETFANTPKNICKYCKPAETVKWNLSNRQQNEFDKTLAELYFIDKNLFNQLKI